MAPRPRITPTAEQLQAAWVKRRRRHWPADFDTAMADPLLGRLVHMEAVLTVLKADRMARRQQSVPLPAQARTAARRPDSTTSSTRHAPDRKRLAAGDTDDAD